MSDSLYTLTFDKGVQGWTSFYSYYPDWMIGMNNYFYSFKNGDLYRHNTNENRNTFYGISFESTIQSVFNDSPLENKLFKTIMLEGDDSWETTIQSDQQTTGFIQEDYYEDREGDYFAFIRNSGTVPINPDEYALRSLNGLGDSEVIVPSGTTTTVFFSNSLEFGSILSVGDYLYYGTKTASDISGITLLGQVTAIRPGKLNGNEIDVDNTLGTPAPFNVMYMLYMKDSVAESHGILGHYAVFDLELPIGKAQLKSELFAVGSEVMKSYP